MKKVIIVGGGISGLTTGIYLLDNGYDVHIYEKHSIPGGSCTGWVRDGIYIDGCAHWIMGTNPKSCLRPIWDHIGAFDGVDIFETDELTTFDIDGKPFAFHANLKDLEKEMLALSPQDKWMIWCFIRTVEAYTHVSIPLEKPLERMNLFETMLFGLSMIKAAIPYALYRKTSIPSYGKKFKDPRLGELFSRFMGEDYNMHSFFYVLQGFCTHDTGIMEGGSLRLATRVANTFRRNGGTIHLNSPVSQVVVEGRKAKGILLEGKEELIEADYVVISTDTFETFNKLLPNAKMPRFFSERYSQKKGYALVSAFQISLAADINMSSYPRMSDFLVEPFEIAKKTVKNFAVRNYSFDKTLSSDNRTLLTILLPTNEATYDYLESLSQEEYQKVKREVGERFLRLTSKHMGIGLDHLSLLDVATPLTYARYTNAYKGAYMSFVTTKHAKGLMGKTILKGYDNLLLGGQWLMPPGGLPIAIMIGKHAAYNLCYLDGKKFVNKEERKNKGPLRTDLKPCKS